MRTPSLLRLIVTTLLLSATVFTASGNGPLHRGIIPLPVSDVAGTGTFTISEDVIIEAADNVSFELGCYLGGQLISGETGRYADAEPGRNSSGVVRVCIDDSGAMPREGYRIEIHPAAVNITGADRGGLFYGIQTFLQLLPPVVYEPGQGIGTVQLGCRTIEDYPRMDYRGMHLDVARTFSDVATVKRYIDHMARHKLNRFHWHLTDDEGWRIEIKSHPELAAVGGFRGGDSPVKNIYGAWGRRYGGYYTQEEIREVVEYAAFRNIEILPEIDLPGHSRTAARVYPQILCRGHADTTAAGYDMRKVWCVAKEDNYRLLEEILQEVFGLFPSKFFIAGGDEVPPEQWEACPDCMALMKEQGFGRTSRLNTYFMQRMEEIAARYGKTLCVWNEAVEDSGLSPGTVVLAWENDKKVKEVVEKGYPTIVMPSSSFYLDMRQSATELGFSWAGTIDLRRVYDYEFSRSGVDASRSPNILGVEGAFWTELMVAMEDGYLDYQVYPRLCALAETAWTQPGRKDWNGFKKRLDGEHLDRLTAMGIGYRSEANKRTVYQIPSKTLKPTTVLTSQLEQDDGKPFRLATDYDIKTYARTQKTARRGDWFLFSFPQPVRCSSINVRTGFNHIPRLGVVGALLEVRYDGRDFETVTEDFNMSHLFHPTAPVTAIKLTIRGDGNGENSVIIQDLVITP